MVCLSVLVERDMLKIKEARLNEGVEQCVPPRTVVWVEQHVLPPPRTNSLEFIATVLFHPSL